MDIWPSIVLIFILIFVNAFFAMSEIAIISINSQKMKRLACLLYTSGLCKLLPEREQGCIRTRHKEPPFARAARARAPMRGNDMVRPAAKGGAAFLSDFTTLL